MPVYAYQCPRCGRAEDRNVPYEQRDAQLCQCNRSCAAPAKLMKRLPSAPRVNTIGHRAAG